MDRLNTSSSYVKKGGNKEIKKITIALEKDLLDDIDEFLKGKGSSYLRSAFISQALHKHLEYCKDPKDSFNLEILEECVQNFLLRGSTINKPLEDIAVLGAFEHTISGHIVYVFDLWSKYHPNERILEESNWMDVYDHFRVWTDSIRGIYSFRGFRLEDFTECHVPLEGFNPQPLSEIVQKCYPEIDYESYNNFPLSVLLSNSLFY